MRRLYWSISHPRTFGVKILIESEKGFLFVRNTYGHHAWTFPGGSKKSQETPENGAIRECFEETGLKISKVKYLGSFHNLDQRKKDTVFCFYSFVKNPRIIIDQQEIADYKWHPLDSTALRRSAYADSVLELYKNVPRGTLPVLQILSRRADGNMRMGMISDSKIQKNQEAFLRANEIPKDNLVRAAVCHGT